MKLKRILALAVSLAMVLSIVPAFEITAGAANAGDKITYNGATYILDTDNLVYNGDFSQTTNDGTYTYITGWKGGYVDASHKDLSNRPYLKEGNAWQSTTDAHFIITPATETEMAYVTTPTTDTMPNPGWGDTMYPWKSDISENYMGLVLTNWIRDSRDSTAATYLKAETGKRYYMSFEMKASSINTNSWVNNVVGFTAVTENGDTYESKIPGTNGDITTLTSVLDNGIGRGRYTTTADTWTKLETVATPSQDGYFMFQLGWAHEWGQVSVRNFEIYEISIPPTIVPVTATYTAGGVPVKTAQGSYNTENGETYATFDAYNYSANGSNVMYHSDAKTLSADETIEMTALTNWGEYTKDVSTLEVGGKVYNIIGSNLIPNGNFAYGLDGWYNAGAAGTAAASANFTTDASAGSVKVVNNGGSGSEYTLQRSWAIEKDKTYAFIYTQDSTADAKKWQRFCLGNDFANNNDAMLLGAGAGDVETGQSVVTGTNTVIFTNTTPYSYANFRAAYSQGVTFSNFGLYEVKEDTSASAKITVQYTLNGTVIPELTQERNVVINNGVNSTVLDAVSYLDNGVYYKADSVTVTNITGDYNSTVALEIDNTKAAPASVFSYDFNDGVTYWAGDNTFNKEDQSATVSIGWGNVRETVMMFKMPEATYATNDKMVSEATLNVNIGFVNGSSSRYTVYAIDPSYVDMTNQAVLNVATDVTHDNLPTAMNAVQVGYVAAITKGWHSIALDLSAVTEQEYLALLITSADQAYTYSMKDPANAPYLSEISERTYDYNNYSLGGYIMKNNVGFETPINEIFMLGAHDSMTEYNEMTGDVDPGQNISEDPATSIGSNDYYSTQKSDIITLLNSGVRYLDIRLTRRSSGSTDWHATHTKVAGYFGSEGGDNGNIGYAQQIVNWLHDNPGELLIFDLQWVYDVDATTNASGEALPNDQKGYGNQASYDAIKRVLQNTKDVDGKALYDYFYNANGKHPNELTYGQLTSNGMKAAAVGFTKDISPNRSNGQTAGIYGFMWRGYYKAGAFDSNGNLVGAATVWSDWPDKMILSSVKTELNAYAAKKTDDYNNKMRVMQAVRSSTAILRNAADTNVSIYNDGNFPTWLAAMPIFMVDFTNVGADSDPDNTTATVTTKTTTVNNADTDFNPTVITDLARFNRNIKFGYTDYTTDHNITFTDNATGASVTGSNFELPVSICLKVTETTPTGSVPTTLNGSNIVKTYGEYDLVFNRFERSSAAENEVTDLGTAVEIAFTKTLSDNSNSFAVLKLNTTTNTWDEVASTYSNGVVTLTNKVTTLDDVYLVVEVEGSKVAATIKYVEAGNETNILKTVAEQNYAEGATIVTMTASSGFYFEGDSNAYIISSTAKTYTTAAVVGGVLTVPVTIEHKNAAVADNFANSNGSADCNNTDNLVFAGASGDSQADLYDADGAITTNKALNPDGTVQGPLGSSRVGLISFKVPEAINATDAVVLNAYIAKLNQNLGSGVWVKPAVIPVSGSFKVEETVGYKAADYAFEAGNGIWAMSTVTQSETGSDGRYDAVEQVYTSFDVTEAVKAAKAANQEYITFRFYVPTGGVYIVDREKAVLGGAYEGKAAYLDVVSGYTVNITDASAVTKNGSAVEVTNNQASIILSTGGRVNLTAADGTAAFVDGSNNLYKLTNGKAEIKNIGSSIVLSGIGAGVSLVDGAQVRVGQGVYDYNGLGYKVTIDGTGSTDPALAASGLRFIGLVDTVGLASYKATDSSITVGIEIAAKNADETYTAAVDIPAKNFQNPGTDTVFTAAIVNLNEGNYNRIFKATPYVMANGDKYYGNSVLRSVYEIAAGILVTQTVDGSTDVPVDVTERVNRVLNAYVNQVGIRLDFSGGIFAARTEGTGAYAGEKLNAAGEAKPEVFFEVTSQQDNGDGTYTVEITTTNKNAAQIFGYWNEYIRLNNQKLADYIVTDGTTLSEDGKTLTLKISTTKQTAAAAE